MNRRVFLIFTTLLGMVAVSVFSWRAGFENGFEEAEEQAAKSWEPLLASGWLDGKADNPHLWSPTLSESAADFLSKSYKSKYGVLMSSASDVPESSRFKFLIENHASRARLSPDEFDEMLRSYLRSVAEPRVILDSNQVAGPDGKSNRR